VEEQRRGPGRAATCLSHTPHTSPEFARSFVNCLHFTILQIEDLFPQSPTFCHVLATLYPHLPPTHLDPLYLFLPQCGGVLGELGAGGSSQPWPPPPPPPFPPSHSACWDRPAAPLPTPRPWGRGGREFTTRWRALHTTSASP
jgi:hypothetical protein